MAVISSLMIRLGVASKGVGRGFKATYAEIDKFQQRVNQSSAALNRIGKGMTSIGVGPGIVAAGAAVTAFAGSVLPATQVALAFPAALAQMGAAGMTVKLGLTGVGDALSAVADGSEDAKEKLGALSPEAARVATTAGGMIKDLRTSTQAALFAGWAGEFEALGSTYSPILRKGFDSVAASLGGVVKAGILTANSPFGQGVVARTFASTAATTDELAKATPSLLKGMFALVEVANPFITQWAKAGLQALALKAEWLSTAEGMQWLRTKLDQGASTMEKLGTIVSNILGMFNGLMGEARFNSQGLLDKLIELTAKAEAWSKSTAGQADIAAWFEKAKLFGEAFGESLSRLVDVALKLVTAFNSLPQPLQDGILQFSAYALLLGPLIARFSSLIGILWSIGGAAISAIAGMYKFMFASQSAATGSRAAWLLAKVQIIASWVAMQVAAALRAAQIGAIWLAMWVQAAAKSAAFTALMYTYAVANWVRMAAAATARAIQIGVIWAAMWLQSTATAIASTAVAVAGVVAGWVVMGVQSLIQAARMAAAWIIAMGPVGWVIAVIVALVILIIANWDTIVEWTKKAWDWIFSKAIKPAADLIMAFVRQWIANFMAVFNFLVELPGRVGGWFMQMHNAIVDKVTQAITFVRSVPGRIWDAISGLESRLRNYGSDMVQGLINGLQDAVGRLVAKARDVATQAMNAIKSALGIGSPSRITFAYGKFVDSGLVNGLTALVGKVRSSATSVGAAAVAGMGRGLAGMGQLSFAGPMNPTVPGFRDDPRSPGSGAPLVSIGTFNAYADQSPDDVARDLEQRMRTT